MKNGLSALLSSLLPLVFVACGSTEAARGTWTTSIDTVNGGSRPILVVNTPPPGVSDEDVSWRFEEIYRVGPSSFASISQVAVDTQDRLAVIDNTTQTLHVFGPDGAPLTTFGGKGAGPGELDGAFGVIADGDEFLVPEFQNARLSVFRADSGFIRSHPARFFSYGLQGWDAVVDSEGRIGVLSSGMLGKSGQQLVRRYDRAMTQLDTFPYRPYEDQPTSLVWRVPFGKRGEMVVYNPLVGRPTEVLDRGERIWRPDEQGEYRLKQFTPLGDTLRTVEVRRPRQPVSATERDSVIEDLRGKLKGQGMPTELDWSLLPELHPAIQEISQSEQGDIWVRTSPMNRTPSVYDVLDGEGRYRGTVSIPGKVKPGVEPFVRGDQVWAVVLGDLDVESVVHGRLVQ